MTIDLVSVVVPVYNVEKYLDRCVSSIVNQSYPNLEIILVDDGSPDRCPQMCEEWAKRDKRIRVIHKTNAGLGMARNTGIEHATGAYICFFDSDDYVAPETIEEAYALAKAEDAEIVVFGMQSVNKDGRVTKKAVPRADKLCYSGEAVREAFLPDLIDNRHKAATIQKLCLSACSCLFSMTLIRETGFRFVSERQNISEDSYSLIWLYQYVNKVAIVQKVFYSHCENEDSLTSTYREDRYMRIKQFYHQTLALADMIGYGEEVRRSISGVFISFSIAAMKQIVIAKLTYKNKKKALAQIIYDEAMRQGLEDISCRTYGRARKVLFFAMRHRLCNLCYILLAAQNRAEHAG